jgi:hypothetical protein
MVEINATELTEDEAELYDRQIRLWGLDSQKRLVFTFRKYLTISSTFRVANGFQKILIAVLAPLTIDTICFW